MFKIPAAATGIDNWKTNYYDAIGRKPCSLETVPENQWDSLSRSKKRSSKQILEKATIEHLDKAAISLAREKV